MVSVYNVLAYSKGGKVLVTEPSFASKKASEIWARFIEKNATRNLKRIEIVEEVKKA